MKMKAEIGDMYLQAQEGQGWPAVNPWISLEAGREAVTTFSLRTLERTYHTDAMLLASGPQNCKRISCYGFKPPSLWDFIIISLGN